MSNIKKKDTARVSTSAWRKLFSNPLGLKRPKSAAQQSSSAALSDDSINAVIEGEIIPRLLMAHSLGKMATTVPLDSEIDPTDAKRFANLPAKLEAANLLEEVDNFLAAGVSVDAIYLDLLAPAARRLGEMWSNDECDFVDVTMGLWRLQEVMREVAIKSPPPPVMDEQNRPSALFAPMLGDQHNFGALMLDEIFSRAGWKSEALPKPGRREILDKLARQPYDLVGLTISSDCPSAAISNLIVAMRSVSANSNICILIGGHVVNEDPSIVTKVGADGTGADARAALETAQKLVFSQASRVATVS